MTAAAPGAAVRAAAARLVHGVLDRGRSLKAGLQPTLSAIDDPRDRALLEAMAFQALRWRGPYEHALSQWLARPLPARHRVIHALLLVGLAQRVAMGLPDHASVSATAEAARTLGAPGMVGLVNALLRRAGREPLPEAPQPWARASHPRWLFDRLGQDWPRQRADILVANNAPAPMWLRVNRLRGDREAVLVALAEAGVEAVPDALHADAVRLEAAVPVARLPGFEQGRLSVQDIAAQSMAPLLAPQPGERVLDACAAPGGKTAHLLEQAGDGLELLALDADAGRLDRVVSTLARLGLATGVTTRHADAAAVEAWWDGRPFDAILLDAPCSATGVIRRQPDVKWHRSAADVESLTQVQARLLDALWPLLRPGGRLLYATCSVLRAENHDQVAAFLARTPDATDATPPAPWSAGGGPGCQRLPGEGGGDGFFHAMLVKSARR